MRGKLCLVVHSFLVLASLSAQSAVAQEDPQFAAPDRPQVEASAQSLHLQQSGPRRAR